jgi:glyoxylase-like metal-dependent hydrolase (beta-lactamase superfamily II)
VTLPRGQGRPLYIKADPVGDYLASFKAFSHVADDALVLPGHGLPFRGVRPRIRALEEHHGQRLKVLEQAIAQPLTAFQAMMALFKRAVEGGHSRLALGETLAHLHQLAMQGRAVAQMHPDGLLRFQASRMTIS